MDEVLKLQVRAIGDFVTRRSIALILKPPRATPGVGSSTCIQVGSHYLLATAGHVIEDLEDDHIDLRAASELSTRRISFVGRSCYPGRPRPATDVAWIELDAKTAVDHHLQFIQLGDIHFVPGQTREHPFLIQGYPWAAVLGDRDTGKQLDLESTLALTMAADEARLTRPLKNHEFAVEYPPRGAEEKPLEAPEPHGMSGGGTWRQPRHDQTVVWTPDSLWLVGINTLWFSGSKVLYCTKIDSWLELVVNDFADTASVVTGVLAKTPW